MDIEKPETVVLLHGLMRRAGSMRILARRLQAAGFSAIPLGYPSRDHAIDDLSRITAEKILGLGLGQNEKIHLATHSLGGIIARLMLQKGLLPNPGRLVMIAPPNRGSELADILIKIPLAWRLYGKPVLELGTGPESLLQSLEIPNREVGVIAGSVSYNPLFSLLINGPNDGKVSVARAGFNGMKDLVVIRRTHSFIMNAPETARQTAHFLKHGLFEKQTLPGLKARASHNRNAIPPPESGGS